MQRFHIPYFTFGVFLFWERCPVTGVSLEKVPFDCLIETAAEQLVNLTDRMGGKILVLWLPVIGGFGANP